MNQIERKYAIGDRVCSKRDVITAANSGTAPPSSVVNGISETVNFVKYQTNKLCQIGQDELLFAEDAKRFALDHLANKIKEVAEW